MSRAGRRRTVETDAATITLCGADSDYDSDDGAPTGLHAKSSDKQIERRSGLSAEHSLSTNASPFSAGSDLDRSRENDIVMSDRAPDSLQPDDILMADAAPIPTSQFFLDVSASLGDSVSPEITNAELGLAEDHFSQPEGHVGLSSLEELDLAVCQVRALIAAAPPNSERRLGLVHKLVQLRLAQQEAKEGGAPEGGITVLGHRFEPSSSGSSKHYCERCLAVIWGVLQAWYRCSACGFCVHAKCMQQIVRTCAAARLVATPHYTLDICPERGLAAQLYRCAECRTGLAFKAGEPEPRLCDYTGLFYCERCHWNDLMPIPARVMHNWDLEPRKVCRASKQLLRLMWNKPTLRITDINPMLFSFVEELNQVKKLREEILIMKRYFLSCKFALECKLLLQLSERQHFVDSSDMYSLCDVNDVASDALLPQLTATHTLFAQHITTDCELCRAKGYVCELCDSADILFPFDAMAIVCAQCSTVLHRDCYMKRNRFCPKCERLSRRAGVSDGS